MTPDELNRLYKSPDAIRNVGNNPVVNQLNNQINQPVNTPNPVQQSKPTPTAYYKYENFAAQQEASNYARRTPYYTTPTQPNAPTPQPPSGAPPTDMTNAGKVAQTAANASKYVGAIGFAAGLLQAPQVLGDAFKGIGFLGRLAGAIASGDLGQLENDLKAEKAKTRQTSPNPATPNIPAQTTTTNAQTCTLAGGCIVRGYFNNGATLYNTWLVAQGAYVSSAGGYPVLFNWNGAAIDGGPQLSFRFFDQNGNNPQTTTTQTAPQIPSISATPPLLTTASASYSANTNDDPALSPPPKVPASPTTPKEKAPEGSNGLPQGLYDPVLTNGLGLGRTTTNTPPSQEFPQGFNATTDTFKDRIWTRYPSSPPIETDKKTETPAKKEEREKQEKKVPLVTPLPYTPPTQNPTTNPTTPNSPKPTETPSKEELEQAKQFRDDVRKDLEALKKEVNDTKTSIPLIPELVALGIGASVPLRDWLRSNTKAASKEAVCEEFQPNACGYNAVKQNTDPLANKLDAAQIARDSNAAIQTGLLQQIIANIATFFDWIKTAFSNTVVDKVVSYLTLITTLHNASMLSRDLGATLTGVFDNALNIAGLQVKDAEGQQITVSTIIGNTFTNFVKSVIGTANYTALTETWAKANRIYQSAINVVDITRSLFDSARSLNELTGNNLGKIGNALRKDGVVSENAYHSMSENNTQFNVYMEKLENATNAVSTLSSISGEILNIQENVTQLQVSRTAFNNAIKDAEPKVIEDNVPVKTDAATKKAASIYTIGDFSIVKEPDTETP
jgi:hypothetical protein